MNHPEFIAENELLIDNPTNAGQSVAATGNFAQAFGTSELVHLLKRTMFGVKQQDITTLTGKTMSQVVSQLLTADPTPALPINDYNDTSYTDPSVAAGSSWVNAIYDGNGNSRRVNSFKAWWIGVMINHPTSIHEKMTLFWANHFSTQTTTINDARYIYKQNALIRANALGNFRQLLKQITIDPGMLIYLNGYLNNKTSPDENYGREMQELFTVGKGPNSYYTEADVKAAAHVLTGYTVNSTTISSAFDLTKHDSTDKQFSAFYNNTIIAGKIGAAGATELDTMIDMILNQPETAMFICRKLYRFFVYYNIDSSIEANVITPMANVFRANNYDIKPVLQWLLTSSYFYDSRGSIIKSPIDATVGLFREFGVVFPLASDYVNLYYMNDYVRNLAANMEQNIGDPPNVAGWPAYYQEPQYHELWINSDTLPKRNILTDLMVGAGYTRNSKKLVIDVVDFATKLPNPADPNALIADSLTQIYSVAVTQHVTDFLKSILLSGQISDHYWSDAWNAYILGPTVIMNKNIVQTRLQSMYKYLLDLAEYQLS